MVLVEAFEEEWKNAETCPTCYCYIKNGISKRTGVCTTCFQRCKKEHKSKKVETTLNDYVQARLVAYALIRAGQDIKHKLRTMN